VTRARLIVSIVACSAVLAVAVAAQAPAPQVPAAPSVSDVRDGRVAVIGENPGIRLIAKEGAPPSTSVSFWRVFQSPVGAGHVCFVTSDVSANGPTPDDIRLAFTDNDKLAAYVASQLMTAFDKAYGDNPFPVRTARFERGGDTVTAWRESMKADGYSIDLVWRDFYEPFTIESRAGVPHNPYTILSTFIPAKTAEVVINGVKAAGTATPRMRGARQSSSAFLAFAETWLKLP
jgi:hypothetical protein